MRSRLLILALAVAGLAAGGAMGQSLTLGGGEGPIEVTAEGAIEWAQDESRITAYGNAKAVRDEVTVTAERLTAYYREADEGTEVHRLEAEGDVTIVTGRETASGRRAVYQLDERRFTLEGAPARLTTPTETITAQERIVYDEGERVAIAQGDATVRREGRVLRARELVARLGPDEAGGLRIDTVEAEGGVTLTNGDDVVTAERGRYDAQSSIATLTGSVKITRDRNQLNGGYAEVNLETGVSRLYAAPPGGGPGRVQGIVVPEDAQGGAGNR